MFTTDVEVASIPSDHAEIVTNLWQLYCYELSPVVTINGVLGVDVDEAGRFPTRDFSSYWQDEWRHAFSIRAGGRLAGFALVSERSRLTGEPNITDMAEFFVLKRFQRAGVGARAATMLFDRFRGRWEVRQVPGNARAITFWRKVIGDYTAGAFTEGEWASPEWSGLVQRFATPDR